MFGKKKDEKFLQECMDEIEVGNNIKFKDKVFKHIK